VPAGGGVGLCALAVAEVALTEQGELSSFGCYRGSVARDAGTGEKG